jgi:preprotein translocase subunit YajC
LNSGALIVLVIIALFGWLFLVRPARSRSRAHAAMQDDVKVDDEIITAGGLHAVVREVDGSELKVEIAPDVVVTLDRRAVAAVAREEPAEPAEQGEPAAGAPEETPPEPAAETPPESG